MRPPARKTRWNDMSTDGCPSARGDFQARWQIFVGRQYKGKQILDVGTGAGQAKPRLAGEGNTVTAQEPAPVQLPVIDTHRDVYDLADKHWHVVTAFDVIEHVPDDWPFLARLLELATEDVIITTPNYHVSKAGNANHIREYTPAQLRHMAGKLGTVVEHRAGDPFGNTISHAMGVTDFDATRLAHLYLRIKPAVPHDSVVGKWALHYSKEPRTRRYGSGATYRKGASWLQDCKTVEDWGCGFQYFAEVMADVAPAARVWGVDGTPGYADQVADLAVHRPRPAPEGLFMRAVLGHNYNWRDVLANALRSFTRRMCLVVFVKLQEYDELDYFHHFGCPVLHLSRPDLEGLLDAARVRWTKEEHPDRSSEYGMETVYYIDKETTQ